MKKYFVPESKVVMININNVIAASPNDPNFNGIDDQYGEDA